MLPSTGLRWPAIRARTTKRVMAVHISPLVRHKDSPVMMAGGGALRPPSPGNLNLGVGVSAANDFESLTLGSRDFGAGGGAGSGREGEERGWEGRRETATTTALRLLPGNRWVLLGFKSPLGRKPFWIGASSCVRRRTACWAELASRGVAKDGIKTTTASLSVF